nr:hypothetical protein [Arsenophonus endosymbiont of Aleurodicus floccissimus]
MGFSPGTCSNCDVFAKICKLKDRF